MSFVPSLRRKLSVEELDFRSPVSESSFMKMGGSVNYIIDYFTLIPGLIIPYAGLEPSIDLAAYIPCDGRAIDRIVYSRLFTAIGTQWGSGDFVSTFNVPDLRAEFLRGTDATSIGAAGRDPDAASRTPVGTGTAGQPGSYQGDAFTSHHHGVPAQSGATTANSPQYFTQTTNYDNNTTDVGGNETRPKNAYVLYLIKT